MAYKTNCIFYYEDVPDMHCLPIECCEQYPGTLQHPYPDFDCTDCEEYFSKKEMNDLIRQSIKEKNELYKQILEKIHNNNIGEE